MWCIADYQENDRILRKHHEISSIYQNRMILAPSDRRVPKIFVTLQIKIYFVNFYSAFNLF